MQSANSSNNERLSNMNVGNVIFDKKKLFIYFFLCCSNKTIP